MVARLWWVPCRCLTFMPHRIASDGIGGGGLVKAGLVCTLVTNPDASEAIRPSQLEGLKAAFFRGPSAENGCDENRVASFGPLTAERKVQRWLLSRIHSGRIWHRRLSAADWTSALLALTGVLLVVFHLNVLDVGQMVNGLQSLVYAALLAARMIFLMPQNEIDLTVGSNYVLTAKAVRTGAGCGGGWTCWPIRTSTSQGPGR